MSLLPSVIPPLPEETARVAQAAFPKGKLITRMRDEVGVLYTDALFPSLFAVRGQPAESPWLSWTISTSVSESSQAGLSVD
jgi:transposase